MPLYTAPVGLAFPGGYILTAAVPPAHAAITPSSVAKIKRAGTGGGPVLIAKSPLLLKVSPVGTPGPLPSTLGMVKTNGPGGVVVGKALPFPSYSVDVPVALLATQTGPFGLKKTPQAFLRFVSWWSATPAW